MSDTQKIDWLKVNLGTFERQGWTSAAKSRRAVHIQNCVILTGSNLKKLKRDQIDIYVDEGDRGAEIIGGFDFDRGDINISLPSEIFGQVWEAAAATDGVWRQMTLAYQDSERSVVGITEATLREAMSGDTDMPFDPKTGRALSVPPRKDPVLAALQSVRTEIAWLSRISWLLAALIAIVAMEVIRR
jgi:hypothetical protein